MIHHEVNLGSVKIRIQVDGAKVAQIVQWRQILYQRTFQMQQGKGLALGQRGQILHIIVGNIEFFELQAIRSKI